MLTGFLSPQFSPPPQRSQKPPQCSTPKVSLAFREGEWRLKQRRVTSSSPPQHSMPAESVRRSLNKGPATLPSTAGNRAFGTPLNAGAQIKLAPR